MKTITFLIGLFIALNLSAITFITPTYDPIYMFFDHNDTIIIEPLGIEPGTTLVSNFDEVGSEIFTHPSMEGLMAEYCKPKYKKPVSCQMEEGYIEKVNDILFIIFPDTKDSELLFTLLNKYKNEEITPIKLLASIP